MLVDDEPIFLFQLKKVINQFSSEFDNPIQVVSECYSGEEALQLIPALSLDVVITDIRMSSVDGIELAKTIQQRWPKLKVILISGYPSFEYAREAIRVNVVDYLLKPIEADTVRQVLSNLQKQLASKTYDRSREILRTFLASDLKDQLPEEIKQLAFPYSGYFMLVIQNVITPFDAHLLLPKNESWDNALREKIHDLLREKEEVWLFPSDNGRELIAIIGMQQVENRNIDTLLHFIQSYFSVKGLKASIAYSEKFNELTQSRYLMQQLVPLLLKNIVIGKPKLVSTSTPSDSILTLQTLLSDTDEKQILFLLSKREWKSFKDFMMSLFQSWEHKDCPSIYVENNLNSITRIIAKQFFSLDPFLIKTLESRVEEIVYIACSFKEAADAFWTIIIHLFQIKEEDGGPKNGQVLFSQIEAHLASHLSEPLTLADLIDIFNISSTSLCNLFRNFSGKSFVEYFTMLRIEKARDLIRDYPTMLMKDIAEIVGYTDQNYFSRVFKTIVGVNPTEYKLSIK